MGRTITENILHPPNRLDSCGREVGTSSSTSEGPKPSISPVGPTVGPHTKSGPPTIFLYPDLCPSPCLSLRITVLLVGHSYYLLKKMGRDLTSTSLMAYLKYSFDIENGFSSSRSIKQYGSSNSLADLEQHESSCNLLTQWDPWETPLQPPLFRKARATKIIYFLLMQSEYHLSCMLSKHWGLLKILQVLKILLMTNDLIPLISWSAT